MAEAKAGEKKQKRPSALKRDIQNQKKNLRNHSYKAKVKTAIRSYETALSQKDESAKSKLDAIFSLMDKGVKKGVFKPNKASRTKSRLSAKNA